jgi:hypothetical protein
MRQMPTNTRLPTLPKPQNTNLNPKTAEKTQSNITRNTKSIGDHIQMSQNQTQIETPQQQKATHNPVMPGIGCLNRRLYIEKYLLKIKETDPCLLYPNRYQTCKKTTVNF